MITTAFIHIWGHRVGAIAWNNATGTAGFEYDSNFKPLGLELSPLKMPLNGLWLS